MEGINVMVCMGDWDGAFEGVVMKSLATPDRWEVNSDSIPICCAIRTVMTWRSSGTVCSWDPRVLGNSACLSGLLLTGSHSVHARVFACIHVHAFAWPTYALESQIAQKLWKLKGEKYQCYWCKETMDRSNETLLVQNVPYKSMSKQKSSLTGMEE